MTPYTTIPLHCSEQMERTPLTRVSMVKAANAKEKLTKSSTLKTTRLSYRTFPSSAKACEQCKHNAHMITLMLNINISTPMCNLAGMQSKKTN